MIVIQMNGGLGNQLFQYAFGWARAKRTGSEMIIDPRGVVKGGREYWMHKYPIEAPTYNWWRRARWKKKRLDHYDEQQVHCDPGLKNVGKNTYFYGYWQSEDYFADCADEIRKQFQPIEPMSGCEPMENCESVSLHIRRGDYVHKKNAAAVHGVCLRHYYKRAVAMMQEKLDSPHFFVFSDEPDWVRENFKLDAPMTVMEEGPAPEDLYRMSRCKHHITANSTFSWWGAWLCEHPEKSVITPDKWYRDDRDISRLIPKGWMRVSNTSEESGSEDRSCAAPLVECGSH